MKRLFSIIVSMTLFFSLADGQEAFKHLDLSLNVGTPGIGFDLAMPISRAIQVRAGADFFPKVHAYRIFEIETGDVSKDSYNAYLAQYPNYDKPYSQWRSDYSADRFQRLADMLEQFTGIQADRWVCMVGVPSMNTAKLLFDIFPDKEERHWHFTAGVYVGRSKIANVYNQTEDMTSLMAVSIYNEMYKRAVAEEPLLEYNGSSVYLPYEFTEKIRNFGLMQIAMGEFRHDIIAKEDVLWDYTEVDDITGEVIHEEGDVRFHKGEVMYKAGDTYYMMPDKDNMVRAKANVNVVRPYVGFGYQGFVDHNQCTQISFDCGLQFWGGVPKLFTEDGIDLVHDIKNVRYTLQRDLNIIDKFPFYPVVSLRITHRLF